jgi:hypothetical protein
MSHDEHRHQLPIVPTRKLGGAEGLEVSVLGLGCMGMSSFFAAPKPEEEMIELIRYAVHSGVTFLHTADLYGPHANEVLVGKVMMNSSALSTLNPLSPNFEAEICAIMSRTIGQNQTDSAESELATGIMMRVAGSCVELYMKIATAGNQRYPAGEGPSGHQIWIRGLSSGEMGCTRRPGVGESSL